MKKPKNVYGYFTPNPEDDRWEAQWLRRQHIKAFINIWWPIPAWVALMTLILWVHFALEVQ